MIVFAISFTFIGIIGLLSAKATERLECENARLRREESDLLHILRIKKSEIRVYLALASKENSAQSTSDMLDLLDKKARHNLLVNVEGLSQIQGHGLEANRQGFPGIDALGERDLPADSARAKAMRHLRRARQDRDKCQQSEGKHAKKTRSSALR